MTPLTPILTGAALYTAVSLIVIWRQAVYLRRRWREVADFQAEVARLKGVLERYQSRWEADNRIIYHYAAERDKLAARLAPFIAKRDRDDKGHFLPTVRSEAA